MLFLLFLLFQGAVQVVHRVGTVGLALQAFNIRTGSLLELARIHQKISKVVQGIALLQRILRGLRCLHQGLGSTLGIAGLLQSGSLVELWDKGIGLLCTGRIISCRSLFPLAVLKGFVALSHFLSVGVKVLPLRRIEPKQGHD